MQIFARSDVVNQDVTFRIDPNKEADGKALRKSPAPASTRDPYHVLVKDTPKDPLLDSFHIAAASISVSANC